MIWILESMHTRMHGRKRLRASLRLQSPVDFVVQLRYIANVNEVACVLVCLHFFFLCGSIIT